MSHISSNANHMSVSLSKLENKINNRTNTMYNS